MASISSIDYIYATFGRYIPCNVNGGVLIMKRMFMLFLGLSATGALAGEAKITGQGHLAHAPEYAEVRVEVQAECFSDLGETRDSANDMAHQIMVLFKTIADPANPQDTAFTSGGQTSQTAGYRHPQSGVLICENTF